MTPIEIAHNPPDISLISVLLAVMSLHITAAWYVRGNSGAIYEEAVVKSVASHGSRQALSLSKGRSRDLFAGIPHSL
jgi:hypothetical protein